MWFPPLWASLFSHKVSQTVPLLSACIGGSSVIYQKHSETAGTWYVYCYIRLSYFYGGEDHISAPCVRFHPGFWPLAEAPQHLLNEWRNGDLQETLTSALSCVSADPPPGGQAHPPPPSWVSCGRSVCRSVPRQQVIHTSLKRNVLLCVTKNERTLKRTLCPSLPFQCFFSWLALFSWSFAPSSSLSCPLLPNAPSIP